jgi:predicted site-specific integrase-resolvase
MRQAVIFVRVSKKKPYYQRQVKDLRVVAQSQAVQIMAEIADKISGMRRNKEQEEIQQLLAVARPAGERVYLSSYRALVPEGWVPDLQNQKKPVHWDRLLYLGTARESG